MRVCRRFVVVACVVFADCGGSPAAPSALTFNGAVTQSVTLAGVRGVPGGCPLSFSAPASIHGQLTCISQQSCSMSVKPNITVRLAFDRRADGTVAGSADFTGTEDIRDCTNLSGTAAISLSVPINGSV